MGKSAVVLSSPGRCVGKLAGITHSSRPRLDAMGPKAGQQPVVVSCYDVDELSKATGVRTHLERLSSDQGEQPPGWSIGDRAHQAKQPSKAAHNPPGCSLTGQANDLQGEAPKAGRPQIQSLKACFGGLAFVFAGRQLGEEDCVPLRPPLRSALRLFCTMRFHSPP